MTSLGSDALETNVVSQVNRKPVYCRRSPMVLINGLAEQTETWFCNTETWREDFDVLLPSLLAYEGESLHRRIESGSPVDLDYLVGRLHTYLTEFVQSPPYDLVANSLGGKIAVEYAVRFPERVRRLVLLCPAGLSDVERMPIADGVRSRDPGAVVDSVFHDTSKIDSGLLDFYRRQFANRKWRAGLIRTVRGTMDHRVVDQLHKLTQPTLLVVGDQDKIVDPTEAIAASRNIPNGKLVVLNQCGHAPQIEQHERVNRLVIEFLKA